MRACKSNNKIERVERFINKVCRKTLFRESLRKASIQIIPGANLYSGIFALARGLYLCICYDELEQFTHFHDSPCMDVTICGGRGRQQRCPQSVRLALWGLCCLTSLPLVCGLYGYPSPGILLLAINLKWYPRPTKCTSLRREF